MMKNDYKMCPIAKFVAWLILGVLVCLIGITNTYALETRTIYGGNNSGSLTNSGKYLYGSNQYGNVSSASVGSTINGVSYGFSFWLYETINVNKTYTLVINFMSSDLLNSFRSDYVNVQSCYSSTCNDNVLISVVKNNNSGYSNKLTIKFNPITNGSYLAIGLSSGTTPLEALTGVSNFGISSVQIESSNQNEDIMNNANQNANNIINNNNSNTQDIINNQNGNTQQIIDELSSCNNKTIEFTPRYSGYYISWTDGSISANANYNVSNFVNIQPNTTYTINFNDITGLEYGYMCWYYDNSVVSCSQYLNMSGYASSNFNVTSPSNANKLTVTYRVNSNANVVGNICGSKLDEQTDAINGINDSINNDNVDSSSWANFFNNFTTNTFGLTSIITAPLNLIQSLTTTSCTVLQLPLPYLQNKYLTLPCMTTIYSQYFGTFFTLYQTITYGIIAYWVCVRIFNLVKDFKNPDHDEIEVVDL